jgi:hypothetical protein
MVTCCWTGPAGRTYIKSRMTMIPVGWIHLLHGRPIQGGSGADDADPHQVEDDIDSRRMDTSSPWMTHPGRQRRRWCSRAGSSPLLADAKVQSHKSRDSRRAAGWPWTCINRGCLEGTLLGGKFSILSASFITRCDVLVGELMNGGDAKCHGSLWWMS